MHDSRQGIRTRTVLINVGVLLLVLLVAFLLIPIAPESDRDAERPSSTGSEVPGE